MNFSKRRFGKSLARRRAGEEIEDTKDVKHTCELFFENVYGFADSCQWSGPVSMSCDDTKLSASLRLYWDAEQKKHIIVGSTSGPCEVEDPDMVRKVIQDASPGKAGKLRLWTLTALAPGAVSVVLHAMPIGSKDWPATQLEPYSQLIRGLIQRKIQVVSYACDG
ncbi:hypothetical protein B0H13DRAFT_1620960, partial [Mycena leptocephala]